MFQHYDRFSLQLILIVCAICEVFSACPAGFVFLSSTGKCYFMNTKTLNWFDAERYCNTIGSHLTTVLSSSEEVSIYDYILSPRGYSYNQVWVGLNDISNVGTWIWIDSSPVSYINWAAGQPNNEVQNCGALYKVITFAWYHMPCSELKISVCKYTGSSFVASEGKMYNRHFH